MGFGVGDSFEDVDKSEDGGEGLGVLSNHESPAVRREGEPFGVGVDGVDGLVGGGGGWGEGFGCSPRKRVILDAVDGSQGLIDVALRRVELTHRGAIDRHAESQSHGGFVWTEHCHSLGPCLLKRRTGSCGDLLRRLGVRAGDGSGVGADGPRWQELREFLGGGGGGAGVIADVGKERTDAGRRGDGFGCVTEM